MPEKLVVRIVFKLLDFTKNSLNQVCNIHGHLINLSIVKLLNILNGRKKVINVKPCWCVNL